MKKIILFAFLVQLSAFAQIKLEDVREEAISDCYFFNTACSVGVDIAYTELESLSLVDDVYNECSKLKTPRRNISCLRGAVFFLYNYYGKLDLMEKAYDTVPMFVYTAGHAVGVTISLLNSHRDNKVIANKALKKCSEISFDNDVLKRCKQGLKAFNNI